MSIDGIGGGAMSVDRVMALRAQILERNQALSRASDGAGVNAPNTIGGTSPGARNVIAGNTFNGIRITSGPSSEESVSAPTWSTSPLARTSSTPVARTRTRSRSTATLRAR